MPDVRLLGTPRISSGNAWTELRPNQGLLLAAYLGYTGEWVSRDTLVGLFWPDEHDATARHNLSQLLYGTRRKAWATDIEAERTRVRWRPQTDVHAFLRAVADGLWSAAARSYGGELLHGVDSGAYPAYDAWLHAERSHLQAAWRDAVVGWARELDGDGDAASAARQIEGLLEDDPLAEDALQVYLGLAERAGRRDRALAAYARFERELDANLGIAPLDETSHLADALKRPRGPSGPPDSMVGTAPEPPEPGERHRPTAASSAAAVTVSTPFVGRGREIAELGALLTAEAPRSFTLVGPGGVGKTRLAVQLMDAYADDFEHGVAFVSLAPVASGDDVARAALEAAGWDAQGRSPEEVLLERAAGLERLWIFDNFEHVAAAADLIGTLAASAPMSRVLVTSRVALRLRGEVLYELGGLGFPSGLRHEQPSLEDAVSLFVQSARRANPAFRLDPAARDAVARICAWLEGLPLGIELAAAWSRTLLPSTRSRRRCAMP